jgi:hypothetical protein
VATTAPSSLLQRLVALLGEEAAAPTPAEEPSKDTPPGTAPAGVDPNASTTELKKNLDDLRSDLRRWGAAIGSVATAVLAGIGWTKVDNLFPFPSNVNWIGPVSVACAVAAVGGSVYIFLRLYGAQRRILVGTDHPLPHRCGLWPSERRFAEHALDLQARSEGAVHMADVEARALRYEHVATRLELAGDELAKAARTEANRLDTFVALARLRVGLALLEKRSRRAMTGFTTWVALIATAFGIAGLFALSNWSQGERNRVKPSPAVAALSCVERVDGAQLGADLRAKLDAACAKLVAP